MKLSNEVGWRILFYFFVASGLLVLPHRSWGQFVAGGDAGKLSQSCYRITKDESNRYGTLWRQDKIDLSKPQVLDFILHLGSKDNDGADGVGLVFHNDPRGLTASGAFGEGLGFGYKTGEPDIAVIEPSVGIEFDTYNNGVIAGDLISQDHTTVVYNGKMGSPQLAPVWINPSNPNIEDNQCHDYLVTWDPATQELKLYFEGNLRFTHKDDIINKVFNGVTEVYFGFTGATGAFSNEQTVCFRQPDTKPIIALDDKAETEPALPVLVGVLQNDSHTGGEPLVLKRVATAPRNGIAVVSGQSILYTPNAGFVGTDSFTYEICEAGTEICFVTCETATVTVTVACKPQSPPTIAAAGPTDLCPGGTVVLTAVSGGGLPAPGGERFVWSTGATGPTITAQRAGAYWVKAVTANGCEVQSAAVQVTVQGAPPRPAVTGGERCEPGPVTLQASGGAEGAYRWYTSPTDPTPFAGASGSSFTTPVLPSSATYHVSMVTNGCESTRVPVQALIHRPAANAGPDQSIWRGQNTRLQASGGVTYQWQPAAGLSNPHVASPVARPEETTTYTVTVTTAAGCVAEASVTVTVLRELIIPNAFSPNGDGVNESWEITNMLSYRTARVEIFNRWGSKIFDTTGYRNDWRGTYQGSPLAVGTYFYVITIDESRKLTGPVSIVR